MQYTASILALAASASAHMTLQYPVPFGQPQKDPLDPSGANFPCQATGPSYYTATTQNEWNAGETKEIEFLGTAVHGGGSCQFSITTDTAPTKDTQWKVIHSVEGGCPAAAEGNLSGDQKPPTFPVTMPKDVPSGTYTFAWTWFNKIGNREMYMNCAPLSVGGGGDAGSADVSSVLGQLPDMFVANMPPEECTTVEGTDVEFTDAGASVVKGDSAKLGSVSGAGCASQTKLGAGAGSMGSPSQATNAPASSGSGGAASSGSGSVATSVIASSAPAATTPAASNTGGIFAPGASSAAGTAPSNTVIASNTVAAPAPSATGGNSTPPSSDCTACSTEGAVVCIGSSKFGLCNQGCAVAQDLASGTTCANGVISRRSVRRFPRAALHRRHGSALV